MLSVDLVPCLATEHGTVKPVLNDCRVGVSAKVHVDHSDPVLVPLVGEDLL